MGDDTPKDIPEDLYQRANAPAESAFCSLNQKNPVSTIEKASDPEASTVKGGLGLVLQARATLLPRSE